MSWRSGISSELERINVKTTIHLETLKANGTKPIDQDNFTNYFTKVNRQQNKCISFVNLLSG